MGYFVLQKKDMLLAFNIKPHDVEPLFILSAINIKQEHYDEALTALTSLEKKKPNNPALLLQIGGIYYRKNDERHIRYFDRLFSALSASEDKAPESYRKAMEILARHHYEKSNLAHAKEVIDFIPRENLDTTMRLIAARIAYGLKDYEGAIAHYEKISIGSEDSAFLAAAYLKTGKTEPARELVLRYYNDEKFISLARNHRGLKSIIDEIDKERAAAQKRSVEQSNQKEEKTQKEEKSSNMK
jgi:hypothetical protein